MHGKFTLGTINGCFCVVGKWLSNVHSHYQLWPGAPTTASMPMNVTPRSSPHRHWVPGHCGTDAKVQPVCGPCRLPHARQGIVNIGQSLSPCSTPPDRSLTRAWLVLLQELGSCVRILLTYLGIYLVNCGATAEQPLESPTLTQPCSAANQQKRSTGRKQGGRLWTVKRWGLESSPYRQYPRKPI